MKSGRTVRSGERTRSYAIRPLLAGGRRLSEGALVQGSVRARLLGVPLLRLDATLVLVPTAIDVSPGVIAGEDGLAEAVRSINAGADILERVRSNGRLESGG